MYRSKLLKNKVTSVSASTSRGQPSQVFKSQNLPTSPEKENNIESSQESTQNKTQNATRNRFLSQRQALLNATMEQQNKGKGPFEIMLFNCGLEITEIGCALQQGDPISFTRRLRVLLTSKPDYPRCARQYIDEFKNDFVLTSEEKLTKCEKLMHGILIGESGSKQFQTQTSLIMCLLAINCFKDEIVKILLERLKEYVVLKDDSSNSMFISTVALVLTQFKFSDQILSDEVYKYMFEELFEILKVSKTFECQEVIVQQFKELEISKQEEAARRLVAMYQTKKKDLLRFLDIFCLMAIDDRTIGEIFGIIQRYIAKECSSEQYLSMIKYSIHYSSTIEDVIDTLRDQVKWESCTKDVIKSIFKIIGKSLIRNSNKTIDAWAKIINGVNNTEDLRYIDFIMLLSIADTNTETQLSAVKKIVLDKISKGLFSDDYLKKSFAIFSPIIANISQALLELLDGLQKTKDNQIYNFMAACYKLLFRFSSEGKEIIGSLANFLCEKRSNLPFASGSDFKITILTILHEIMNDSPKSAAELVYNHKILLRALNISCVELTVNEHRSLLKLLSTLIYNIDYGRVMKPAETRGFNEVKDTLAEHLNMVNSKYISNPTIQTRRLGIIGAVKVISSLVFDKLDDSNISAHDIIQPEEMPKPIHNAVRLIELIFMAAEGNYEMLAMLFNEMSLEFKANSNSNRQISQIFVNWFGEKVFVMLNKLVQTEVDVENLKELNLIGRFENVDDSFENPELTVPLGSMLLNGKMEIIMLPSLFKLNLLAMLYRYGNEGALQCISGLCAMAITLPEKYATAEDELDDDVEMAKLQLDLYFHCCNWFRELISGFIKSKDGSILKLVKSRLKQLIQIEKHLNRLLKKMPSGYIPPLINETLRKTFEGLTKEKIVSRPPKIRKKATASPEKGFKLKSNQFCREMDNDIVHLLKDEFLLNTTSAENENFSLTELMYILEDVHRKLELLFKPKNSDQKVFVNEMLAIKDLGSSVLPHLARIFENLNTEIMNCMEVDAHKSKVSRVSSKCFDMILEMFNMVLRHKKLKNEDKILVPLLKVLVANADLTHMRFQDVVCSAVIEHYSKFAENVLSLSGAMALVDFISIVSEHSSSRCNYKHQIIEMVEKFLRRDWEDVGVGSAFNTNVDKLVVIYVTKASNIEEIADLVNEIENLYKNNRNDFPCINKSNFICIIRSYLRRTSEIITSTNTNMMNFAFWETCTKIQSKFIETVKCQKSAAAMNLFLKNFVVLLKRFNTDGISVLKTTARTDQLKCVDLLKNIQRIRRSAHGVVCELKHRKNVGISKILPTVRQQLEIFYQETGSVIMSEQIPIHTEGALRNFDLNSVDIFSQNTTAESKDGSDSESEESVDDSSVQANMDTSSDDSDHDNSKALTTRSRSTIL